MFRDRKSKKVNSNEERRIICCYNKALDWIKNNTIPEQGIVVSSEQRFPYLEVTGYLIPTMLEAGEQNTAERYAEFLSYMQRPNGAFAGSDGKEYAFDTAQALRGLLIASKRWVKYRLFAAKAAEYLLSLIEKDGRIPASYSNISEYVHVFILPVLSLASQILDQPEYNEAAKRSLAYYKNVSDVLSPNQLTHFLAYVVDGFIDMDEADFVRHIAKKILLSQTNKGGIPAFPNSSWVCSVGLAQFAIIGYKLGMYEAADKAVDYLCSVQNPSGGFYGSYGKGGGYFPKAEISWANKFFMDAIHLKISSFFNRNSGIFPKDLPLDDGRFKKIMECLGNLENKRILDAGCGKGRFLTRIKTLYPSCEVHGVDISEKLLHEAPDFIFKKEGGILSLPYDEETFDGIFCVEVLEHAVRKEKAIEEMCRVLKPDCSIVIIDKNVEKLGKIKITDFEEWFDKNEVKGILRRYCCNVQAEEIGCKDHETDGLFLAWSGTKRSHKNALDIKGWHDTMLGTTQAVNLANKIRSNLFPVWSKHLLQHFSPGESFLELGSGTGELSAILAIYGRRANLLDFSDESISFAKRLFGELKIEGHFYCQNVLEGIPLKDNSVDWVWSSGLLEHFTNKQVMFILKESFRVCKKGIISLVPNANSFFYVIGKLKKEKENEWIYGKEIPKISMQHYFEATGLKGIKEFSVGAYHSTSFLCSIQNEIKNVYDILSLSEIQKLNQGYLLFTYGEKPASIVGK